MNTLLLRALNRLVDSTLFIEECIALDILTPNKTSKELLKLNKRLIKELKNELHKVRVPRGEQNEKV